MSPLVARALMRHLARHPWQAGLAALGVALGVAVVVAIDLANASATRAFELSVEGVAGRATHAVEGGPQGLPDDLFRAVVVDAGIGAAAPVVEGYATAGEAGTPGASTLHVLGVDPFSEAPFRPYLAAFGGAAIRLDLLVARPGAALLDTETAAILGVAAGDTFPLSVGGLRREVEVVGLLTADDARSREALANLLVLDVASAQELLGKTGRLDRIDLRLPDAPAARAAALDRLAAVLPPSARLEPAGAETSSFRVMTRSFRLNLTALALLALVCGLFLIYNTMTFSVIQRRERIGTLRALGVTRREIFAVLLAEALVVGTIGTALGLGLGVLLGQGLVRLVTRTINDLYFAVSVRELAVEPERLAIAAAVGVGASLLAAAVPASEASSAPPRTAMSRSELEGRVRQGARRAGVAGGVLFAAGLAALALSDTGLAPAFGGLFAIIMGCALATPLAVAGMMALLRRPAGAAFGVLGRLAAREVVAALSRTGVAASALVIAVSVTVGIGVMIASFRTTVVDWLDVTLRADVYVQPAGAARPGDAGIAPDVVALIAGFPGVERVELLRATRMDVPVGGEPPATLPVRVLAVDLGGAAQGGFRIVEGDAGRAWPAVARGEAVLVSEPLALRFGLAPGGEIPLPTPEGLRAFPVAAVFAEYGAEPGAVLVDLSAYRRIWRDETVSGVSAFAAPGTDVGALAAGLRRATGARQQLVVRSNRDLRELSLATFDQTFLVTRVLRLLAGLVAGVGVLSALMALQLERAHELAVLRATGLTPGQVWKLITCQTGLLGLAAGLLSVPVGLVLAAVMIFVVNRRSFGWTLEMSVAPEILVQAVVLSVVAALAAGLYPAWRMSRTEPATALRSE